MFGKRVPYFSLFFVNLPAVEEESLLAWQDSKSILIIYIKRPFM